MSGRSRPRSCRSVATRSGEAYSPRMRMAGSPGTSRSTKNRMVRTETAVSGRLTSRRAKYAPILSPPASRAVPLPRLLRERGAVEPHIVQDADGHVHHRLARHHDHLEVEERHHRGVLGDLPLHLLVQLDPPRVRVGAVRLLDLRVDAVVEAE